MSRRVLLTGATGFLGGNVAAVLAARGVDVLCAVRRDPGPDFPWPWRTTDSADEHDLRRALDEHRSTDVLHMAIRNDFHALDRDRRGAFDDYVGLTRRVVDAANAHGARVGYVSTDWVFDGTTHATPEDLPVSPLNTYGLYKALSEQVVVDRADAGFVARVGAVQGRHLTAPRTVRVQDAGFGYLALSLVTALSAGQRFTVWDGPGTNAVASPVLAAEIGAVLHRAMEVGADGVLHVVGADAVSRTGLAAAACEVFDLDPDLLDTGPLPPESRFDSPVPVDTSLSTPRTDDVLGTRPHPLADQLAALRRELLTGEPAPLTTVDPVW